MVRNGMEGSMIFYQDWMRNLGVDQFSHITSRRMPMQRIQACRLRLGPIARLRNLVGKRIRIIVNSGLRAAWRYGCAVFETSDHELQIQRATAASALGFPGGSHTTLPFMVEGGRTDPIFDATMGPVGKFCARIWDH